MSNSIGCIVIAGGRPLVLVKGERLHDRPARLKRYGVLFFAGTYTSPVTLFRSKASAKGAIRRTNKDRRSYNVGRGYGDVDFESEFGKCSIYRVASEL